MEIINNGARECGEVFTIPMVNECSLTLVHVKDPEANVLNLNSGKAEAWFGRRNESLQYTSALLVSQVFGVLLSAPWVFHSR